MAAETDTLERTPLHARHVAAGARLVPFAGWEMPVQYPAGIRAEHTAVRERAGVFDVSHMGEIETRGPGAEALLQRLLTNDVTRIADHGAQYALLCNEAGGVLDDLFTYRLAPDRFLTVTNAANHERDLAWFQAHADGFDATVTDRIDDLAMLAVQGPEARALVGALTDPQPLPARFATAERTVAGVPGVLVCGTGYTGEDGVELLIPAGRAVAVWDAVVAAGAEPVGLGARDTLRTEALLPPLRQRPVRGPGTDRGRAGLGLQGGHRVHRRRAGRPRPRGGHGRAARPLRDHRQGHRPPGQPDRGRGDGDVRDLVADPRHRHRPRLPAVGARRAGYPVRDRRARHHACRRKSARSH